MLVISAEPLNQQYDVVSVVPITSRKNNRTARLGEVLLPAGVGGLPRDSFLLCYQVRSLDKGRLTRNYGEIVDTQLQDEIRAMLSLCLDLD